MRPEGANILTLIIHSGLTVTFEGQNKKNIKVEDVDTIPDKSYLSIEGRVGDCKTTMAFHYFLHPDIHKLKTQFLDSSLKSEFKSVIDYLDGPEIII